MFSSLFAPKGKVKNLPETQSSEGVFSRMKKSLGSAMDVVSSVSGRVATVLGLTLANPAVANAPTQVSPVLKTPVRVESCLDLPRRTLPPKGFFTPHTLPKEPDTASRIAELPKATARKGDSVSGYMKRSFGTKKDWEGRLVSTKGDVVVDDTRDLKAGETYYHTEKTEDTKIFSAFLREHPAEKNTAIRTKKTSANSVVPAIKEAPKKVAKKPTEKPAAPVILAEPKKIAAKKIEAKPIIEKAPAKKPKPLEKLPAIPVVDTKPLPKIQAPKVVSRAPKAEIKATKKSAETPSSTISKKAPLKSTGSKNSAPVYVPAPEIVAQLQNWQITLDAYYHGLGFMESGGNYAITNNIGAKGKWQFMPGTLKTLGFSDNQIRIFGGKPALQKYAMDKFTYGNVQLIMREPVLKDMIGNGLHPVELLAAMHHMGPDGAKKVAEKAANYSNQVTAFKKSLKGVDDGNISTYRYTQIIKSNYLSTLNTGAEETKKAHTAPVATPVVSKKSDTSISSVSSQKRTAPVLIPTELKKPLSIPVESTKTLETGNTTPSNSPKLPEVSKRTTIDPNAEIEPVILVQPRKKSWIDPNESLRALPESPKIPEMYVTKNIDPNEPLKPLPEVKILPLEFVDPNEDTMAKITPFIPLSRQNKAVIERLSSTSEISQDVTKKFASTLQEVDINDLLEENMVARSEGARQGNIEDLQILAKLHEIKNAEKQIQTRFQVEDILDAGFGDDERSILDELEDDRPIAELLAA